MSFGSHAFRCLELPRAKSGYLVGEPAWRDYVEVPCGKGEASDSMKRKKEGEREGGLAVSDSQLSPDVQSPSPCPPGSEPSDHSSPAEALDDYSLAGITRNRKTSQLSL